MTKRVEQVESALHRAVAEVLRDGLADPRWQGLVSVTRVEVSPDLHNAFVYVSVLPDKYVKRVMAALKHATKHLQLEVRKKVAMRTVPRLEFRFDEQLAKQNAVLQAIAEANRRSGGPPQKDAEDSPADEAPEAR